MSAVPGGTGCERRGRGGRQPFLQLSQMCAQVVEVVDGQIAQGALPAGLHIVVVRAGVTPHGVHVPAQQAGPGDERVDRAPLGWLGDGTVREHMGRHDVLRYGRGAARAAKWTVTTVAQGARARKGIGNTRCGGAYGICHRPTGCHSSHRLSRESREHRGFVHRSPICGYGAPGRVAFRPAHRPPRLASPTSRGTSVSAPPAQPGRDFSAMVIGEYARDMARTAW